MSRRSGEFDSERLSASALPSNRRVTEPPPQPQADKDEGAVKKRPRKRRLRAGAWLRRLSLMTGVIVVISASVAVAWGMRRYLRNSPRFAVKTVHVEGNERRTAHQVAKRAGVEPGNNVFAIDEERAAKAVETDPWISKAEVRVELPSSVFIAVTEREARAIASIRGELYLIDTSGDIFKKLVEGDPSDLPVVTGIDVEGIARDRDAVTVRIRRALELAAELELAKISKRYPTQEINIQPDMSVTVTIGSDGVELHFGTPPYRSKVAKAHRILQELRYRKVKRAVLFLDNVAHPERVVVRMRK